MKHSIKRNLFYNVVIRLCKKGYDILFRVRTHRFWISHRLADSYNPVFHIIYFAIIHIILLFFFISRCITFGNVLLHIFWPTDSCSWKMQEKLFLPISGNVLAMVGYKTCRIYIGLITIFPLPQWHWFLKLYHCSL